MLVARCRKAVWEIFFNYLGNIESAGMIVKYLRLLNMEVIIKIFLMSLPVILYKIYKSNWYKQVVLVNSLPGLGFMMFWKKKDFLMDSKGLYKLAHEVYPLYGSIFKCWIAFFPMVVILEPEIIKKIIGSYKNINKIFLYSFMQNFLGEGLVTINGEKWKIHRKLLQSGFTKQILENHVTVFLKQSQYMVDKLSNNLEYNKCVNITTFINEAILDILNETVLGIPLEIKHVQIKNSPYRKGYITALQRTAKPWLLLKFLYNFTQNASTEIKQNNELKNFTKKIIKERKCNPQSVYYSDSLLDKILQICEHDPELTDDDVANEICTFMLAGQDTVAAATAFCLYYLAKHQDIQKKVHDEQQQIFSQQNDNINIKHINKMTYLNQCIKETLRLCPSIPIIGRTLTEDVCIGDKTLPEGTDVIFLPFTIHRLPHIYPDPLKFNPDRFSEGESTKRPTSAYMPFSLGPRNCIGYKFAMLEIKCVISTILRNYCLSVKDGYELEFGFRVTLRAKGGVWLKFEQRK